MIATFFLPADRFPKCDHPPNNGEKTGNEDKQEPGKKKSLREAPLRKLQGLFGHCQNGAGGLNAGQDGLGHPYIWVKMREEVPQSARLSDVM